MLVKLVVRMLAAKKKDLGANATPLEREINQRVYALYGLTGDGIKLVEEVSKV